jgi:hypothetical protein
VQEPNIRPQESLTSINHAIFSENHSILSVCDRKLFSHFDAVEKSLPELSEKVAEKSLADPIARFRDLFLSFCNELRRLHNLKKFGFFDM